MRSMLRCGTLAISLLSVCGLSASAAFAQPCEGPPVIYPGLWESGWIPGEWGSLQVYVESEPDLAFQWRRNSQPLSDDERVVGSRTEFLYVARAEVADDGLYDVVVTNACGPSVSDAVEIEVSTDRCFSRYCWCDINQDGGIDGGDVEYFFGLWEAGSDCADTNRDGGVDGGDIEHYLCAWEMCCC